MIIALAGRDIRPTMGFHRVIELLPSLADKGLEPEVLIPGNIRNRCWPAYRRDFLDLVRSSPARRQIRFSASPVTRREYFLMMGQADLVVLPYEAGDFGALYSDALDLGKPVVVSDLKGFRQAIKRTRAGLVVRNLSELRDAILRFFNNPGLRKRLAQNAASFQNK